MNSPVKLSAPQKLFTGLQEFICRTAPCLILKGYHGILCGFLAFACPFAAFAQAPSSSQQSSSQSSPAQSQSSSQAQPAAPAQPPEKQDSLAEAARKAKEKKPATAKTKVYTEDDLSSLKGSGVSVVGEAPKKGTGRSPSGDGGQNNEQYWRWRARQILDQIAAVDEAITQKKEEIKKYGSGGFDVTTGMKQNVAYINDRNGQVQSLEKRKADLQKQLDDLQEEGRKAGASPSWFR